MSGSSAPASFVLLCIEALVCAMSRDGIVVVAEQHARRRADALHQPGHLGLRCALHHSDFGDAGQVRQQWPRERKQMPHGHSPNDSITWTAEASDASGVAQRCEVDCSPAAMPNAPRQRPFVVPSAGVIASIARDSVERLR